MRFRGRAFPIVAAVVVVLIMAAPAAAGWQESFRDSGTRAAIDNGTCTDNGDGTVTCSGQSISIFVGKTKFKGSATAQHYEVCYYQYTDTFNPETREGVSDQLSGCALNTGTITIDDLTSVTVASTIVQLSAIHCDFTVEECTEPVPDGSVVVSGTWTGVGPVVTNKSHGSFDDGTCRQIDMSSGSSREAVFTGTVDGAAFVTRDAFTQIEEGTFSFRNTCSFG